MGDVFESIFGEKESGEERAARRLQAAESQETRRREERENRRRASTAKTLTGAGRRGSLFPSDFAPNAPSSLG